MRLEEHMTPEGEDPLIGDMHACELDPDLTDGSDRDGRRLTLPPMSVLPTLVTLGNLVAGFAAIHYAAKSVDDVGVWGWSSLTMAGALVFVGMFLDSVDGSVARLTRSVSDLGGQLDSFADLVTFGVAPAFMMLRLASRYLATDGDLMVPILGPESGDAFVKVLWGIAAVYVCCTALRLARFNVETESGALTDHLTFRGLPSPGAAGAVVSLIMLQQHLLANDLNTLAVATSYAIPGIVLLCSIAMVSAIPYPHLVNRYLLVRRGFTYVTRFVLVLFFAIWWLQETIAFGFTVYALMGPAKLLIQNWKARLEPS